MILQEYAVCSVGDIVFNKILVANDGSKTAEKAMDFAFDLAEKYLADVLVVSVFDVNSTSLDVSEMLFAPVGTTKYLEELETFYENILEAAIKKAKRINKNLKVTKKLLTGRAADKIVETANDENVDLIVIGSRGLGGIKEIFLGSVSDRVADETKCPVLIVKESNKK